MEGSVSFRWLGVAGIELKVNGQTLLIDPFFTRPPAWRIWFGRVAPNHNLVTAHVKACHYVLVTHAHWDHLMDVPDILGDTGACVLGSANTCKLLAACGVSPERMREIRGGERVKLGGFRVEVRSAEHVSIPGFWPGPLRPNLKPPLRLRDYRMDACFSFLIEVAGMRLLDWPGIGRGRAPQADVLFVGMAGAWSRFEPLLPAVKPRLVVPVHWDDLFRPLYKSVCPALTPPGWELPPLRRMDPARFKRMAGKILPEANVLIPEIFHPYDLRRAIG